MKKVIGAVAALVLVGALVTAGCEPADDDCDARGAGIELTAAHTGKGGGSRSRSRSGGSRSTGSSRKFSKPHSARHSHHSYHSHHGDDCDD